jgi:hypothetical protein
VTASESALPSLVFSGALDVVDDEELDLRLESNYCSPVAKCSPKQGRSSLVIRELLPQYGSSSPIPFKLLGFMFYPIFIQEMGQRLVGVDMIIDGVAVRPSPHRIYWDR